MARSFNGTTDQIVTSGNCGFTDATFAFSLSAWVYVTASNAGAIIATSLEAAPFDGIFFYIGSGSGGNNHLSFLLGTQTNLSQKWTTASQAQNTWFHAAITYDGSGTNAGMLIYLNGVQPTTANNATNPNGNITNRPFYIGSSTNNLDFLAGRVADGGAWNVALSAGEISGLANGAKPYQIRPTSLIRYWPLDGLQSPEPDLSGGAHNGTLSGTAPAAGPPAMMFTPRWPLNSPFGTATSSSTGASFLAAWAQVGQRMFGDGIGV